MEGIKFLSSLFLVLVLIGFSSQKTYIEDLTLSRPEKEALDEFRELMKDRVPHDYMAKDIYLIRWLRAQYFNIPAAEKMLLQHLKWREENKMDNILNEDWSDMDREYKYYLEGRDKEGKPLLYISARNWDLRRAVLSGNNERFNRYIDKGLEDACGLVREMGEKQKNVSQGILLINVEGFNLVQHTCLRCIQTLLRVIVQYEYHWPGCADKIIVVNVPQAAEFVIPPARQLLSKETNRGLYIMGTNKRVWQKKLREWFEPSFLPPELGGTKPYKGMEYEDY